MEQDEKDLRELPRAPSQAVWDAMSPEERQAVVDALPCTFTEAELAPPEGDPHRIPVDASRDALGTWFRRRGKGVYIGVDLAVYYPDTQRFAPDLFIVFDTEPSPRDKWVVSNEGQGLDWVLEVLYSGDRKKDLERNVERYARLGIPEYFVYDRRQQRLHGYRLPTGGDRYAPIIPQAGLYVSQVLGLDLAIEQNRVRFYSTGARLPETPEILSRLEGALDDVQSRADQAEIAREAAEAARVAAENSRDEAEKARAAESKARKAAEAALEAAEQARAEEAKAHAEEAKARAEEAKARAAAEARVAELEALLAQGRDTED